MSLNLVFIILLVFGLTLIYFIVQDIISSKEFQPNILAFNKLLRNLPEEECKVYKHIFEILEKVKYRDVISTLTEVSTTEYRINKELTFGKSKDTDFKYINVNNLGILLPKTKESEKIFDYLFKCLSYKQEHYLDEVFKEREIEGLKEYKNIINKLAKKWSKQNG